ncbi:MULTISPECIES: hypothetical protein [Bradyrhizobium]|uniref:Putative NUDIX family NTP pyrophosphohydrolase n=2 Tax=Bradyrhizobium elkanii TaxID=29448 RepID=A0A8I1Y7Z3_BRAEL|nr:MULTISPECIES: hypothetical protein [Bradyrhizobium]MBP1293940.1 putative NUDIX family NTP pyrophosphohydrolase [Bradyrhizobium elkanii]MCS3477030.1 putative NUDIX family NTP pyrophosphohydrolase [Bradyrhizobium elkanii]MCS3583769.1 putative NUDIX family NTP pyrophosphohydrolase [Bradyrhizobium elkanii]MCS3717339.1 putative NUDIX family NTP pyrophosphohydrolase [Bradyrhizobium elkanii]MCS4011057.1 putative NUDIX family NTP pyrophosphohydrolase [Bradyrhizobium elkanii USDA 61]
MPLGFLLSNLDWVMVMGNVVHFPESHRANYEAVASGADFRQSVRQVLLMLELQLLQISGLVAMCPAGRARTKLQQQHDQLLGRLATARQHARALIGD